MKPENIVKSIESITSIAVKAADLKSKSGSEQNKATCDTVGKAIDTFSQIEKSTIDGMQTTPADVEFTKEYKYSSTLDDISKEQLKAIIEDKMTPEKEERLNALKQEEVARKERDEDRASKERSKKRKETFLGQCILTTLCGGFTTLGIYISKNNKNNPKTKRNKITK